jgi:hypothetical protein
MGWGSGALEVARRHAPMNLDNTLRLFCLLHCIIKATTAYSVVALINRLYVFVPVLFYRLSIANDSGIYRYLIIYARLCFVGCMLESSAEVGKMKWFDKNIATLEVVEVFLNDSQQNDGGEWHGSNPT